VVSEIVSDCIFTKIVETALGVLSILASDARFPPASLDRPHRFDNLGWCKESRMTRFRLAFDRSVDAESSAVILKILNDPEGWASLGHSFEQVSQYSSSRPNTVIRFESDAGLARLFPRSDLRGLSVTNMSTRPSQIFFNRDNWISAPRGFSGSLASYREYLVQHEAGHAFLGLDHLPPRCDGDSRCPVMYQQSLQTGGGTCSPNAELTDCDRRLADRNRNRNRNPKPESETGIRNRNPT